MAWVDNKWIDREERAERIVVISERATKLKKLVQAGHATEYHIEMLRGDITELKRLTRIHRAEVDMLYFFYEYFSEARNPSNPDNLVPTKDVDVDDAPDFHRKLSRILDSVSNVNRTARNAWAASRGHVAGQLKYNVKLRADFGELLYEKKTMNEKDSEEAFLTTSGAKMEATSLGMQIRGFRNGAQRPDLILLDDLESRDSNNTPELRQKAKDWLNQDLMPAYDPTQTAIIFMGTLVHHDSLLNYVLKERKDFVKNSFPAIIKQPERSDLWAEFERIYKEYEPSDEEIAAMEETDDETAAPTVKAALTFFESHREEMEKGAEVLWPSRFPIQFLVLEKMNYGNKAFNTEFQNNPIDEESQIFKPERFKYYDLTMKFNLSEYYVGMGIDFAMGKQRGDYSAIVTTAKHKKLGHIYVVDAFGARIHPDEFMRIIVEKVMHYQPDSIAAEAQMAQEFFVHKLKQELQLKGYPARNRVKEIHQRTRKELRIEAMLPDIENETIRFNRDHTLLLEQFERYGSKWHDDLPDAMEISISTLKSGRKRVRRKPEWL